MKKRHLILSLLMVLVLTPLAMATTLDINRIGGYFSGGGGEFSIYSKDLSWVLPNYSSSTKNIWITGAFQSFCVELTEYVSIPGTYDFTISDKAIAGGVGPAGDPISMGTAWLYSLFARGSLPHYNYTPGDGRKTSAGYLQEIIWYLEDESTIITAGNPFDDLLISKFGSLLDAKKDHDGSYAVKVLNLWTRGHSGKFEYRKQDQLVYVPEPGILILLGIGLSGVGILARRYRKR